MDLTALPVTPEELDAWLCSTDVDDGGSEAQRQHQEETPTTPMSTLPLLSTPSQSSAQPKNDECHDDVQANSKSQQQCYDHRRSSLDFVSASNLFAGKDYFGIDERTMLMASFAKDVFGHHGENCRLVSESSLSISDATDRSPTSSIDSREPVNRDAILSQMEQTQPMPFMEWRGRPKGSHHGVPCPQQLSRHGSASSCSAKTCASSDTIPVRKNFNRSVSDQVQGYDRCTTPPFQREGSPSGGSSPSQFCRSLSLPGNNSHTTHSRNNFDTTYSPPVLYHSQSMPTPLSTPSPNNCRHSSTSNLSAVGPSQDISSHLLLSAMEQSQQSQDCIGRRINNSSRSIAMMRETTKNRGMLLSVLSGASSSGAGNHHARGHGHRRASDNSAIVGSSVSVEGRKPFRSYTHHFRNKRVDGGWTYQPDMSFMMKKDSIHSSGGNWRPAPKHQQCHHSNDYSSMPNMHHPMKQNELEQESAVQAELRRIAQVRSIY